MSSVEERARRVLVVLLFFFSSLLFAEAFERARRRALSVSARSHPYCFDSLLKSGGMICSSERNGSESGAKKTPRNAASQSLGALEESGRRKRALLFAMNK